MADDPGQAIAIVRRIVAGKTANQRTNIRRALRDHGAGLAKAARAALDAAEIRLPDIVRRVLHSTDICSLRGIEGEAAQVYFSVFDHLILVEDRAFAFTGRSGRPPLDRINPLLSFLYAMLGHDGRSALESVGLDPQVGYLHADRPGRTAWHWT